MFTKYSKSPLNDGYTNNPKFLPYSTTPIYSAIVITSDNKNYVTDVRRYQYVKSMPNLIHWLKLKGIKYHHINFYERKTRNFLVQYRTL